MTWKKGESGNPTGRTKPQMTMAKYVAHYIAERTDNGKKIVDRLIELGLETEVTSPAERRIVVAALEALLERGAGKATQEVQISVAPGPAAGVARLRQLTDEELELAARLDEADPEPGAAEREIAAASNGLQLLEAGGDQGLAAPILDAHATEVRS